MRVAADVVERLRAVARIVGCRSATTPPSAVMPPRSSLTMFDDSVERSVIE